MPTSYQINDYIPDPNTGKDRWQIHKIFKGGMGVVYIVYDTEFREAFAVKTYQDKLQSVKAQEQFKKEALIWINLDRHENIAWAKFVENIHNRFYLFLEYVSGGDLSRWIGAKRLDLKQVLLFAIQFCYGMEHALAKGVKAHRDIKPQNCLITDDGTLKITDFGLAKALHTPDFEQGTEHLSSSSFNDLTTTLTGQAGGTLPYMAPEQFDDLKRVDVKADIYSFGIMLYEMICGQLPFIGNTYKELREKHQKAPIPDLPPFSITQAQPLADIVQKCLAKKPWERYADFSFLRKELTQLYKTIYKEKAPAPKKGKKLNVDDLCNKGAMLFTLGHIKEAISYQNEVRDIDPEYIKAWLNKGSGLVELGRYKAAVTCYDHALKYNPKLAEALNCKGAVLEKLGKYNEALSYINQALRINSKHLKALYNKGVVLGKLERYDEAIACYDYALKIDPKHISAWYNKGLAFINLKQNEEALICFDKVLKIDLKHAYAWHNMGVAFGNMRQLDKALKCFQKAHVLGYSGAAEAIEQCQKLLDKQE